jgi:thioesterase domain-containing protein
MMVRMFLEQLQASDVKVWVEGDRLRCNAPQGVLTAALQEELRKRKPEIIAFLRATSLGNSSLVPIQAKGSRIPFFGFPGHNGDVFCFVRLGQYVGDDQPFYALQPPGIEGECEPLTTVSDLAAHYVREMRTFLPGGPFLLGGYCAGGAIAFEVAQQLMAQGETVALFVMFDAICPTANRYHKAVPILVRYLSHRVQYHVKTIAKLSARDKAGYLMDRARNMSRMVNSSFRKTSATDVEHDCRENVANTTLAAVRAYRPRVYPGRIHHFMASELSLKQNYGLQEDWRKFVAGGLQVHIGPDGCVKDTMLLEPFAEFFANRLRECIDDAGTKCGQA